MNLFYIDVETTGLDYKKHEIIELAFCIEINGVIHCKVELFMRPEKWKNISQKALDKNGWTVERLKKLPDRIYGWMTLLKFMREHMSYGKFKIVEYGNNFDSRFLKKFWDKAHIKYESIFKKDSINVLFLARKKLPGLDSYKLENVARHLCIPVIKNKLHSAGYDRDLMIDVYNKLKWR